VDTAVRNLNKTISRYDRELFAKRDGLGMIRVLRKAQRFLSYSFDGAILHYAVSTPSDVFCLTDNWTIRGRPVEWGIEPVLARLKAIDVWSHPEIQEELIKNIQKSDLSERRDLRNNIESFLLDFRKQFAKAFNDINTSTLDKKADPRWKKEKVKWQS